MAIMARRSEVTAGKRLGSKPACYLFAHMQFQLIWWYLLHNQNKIGRGEILVQLSYKAKN